MYSYCVSIFCVTTFFINTLASNQFEMAVYAHKNAEYEEAYRLYSSMPVKTSNSIFNMGLIAYNDGLYPQAIALWRLSCSMANIFNSYDVIQRVDFAINKLKDEQDVPHDFSGHPMDSKNIIYHSFFLFIWYLQLIPLWLLHVLCILISISLAILLFKVLKSPLKKRSVLLSFLLVSILLSFILYGIKLRTALYGVAQQAVELRQGPDDFFEPIIELSKLTELLIQSKVATWYKVRYQDAVGWVPEDAVYLINKHELFGVSVVNRS